jgi:hypothetical protein
LVKAPLSSAACPLFESLDGCVSIADDFASEGSDAVLGEWRANRSADVEFQRAGLFSERLEGSAIDTEYERMSSAMRARMCDDDVTAAGSRCCDERVESRIPLTI